MSKIDPKLLEYEGCDLEAMSQAPKYYKWLISVIKPYFGDTIVEIGAGSGSFSKQLLAAKPKKAIFVEPTKNMFRLLKQNVAHDKSKDTVVKTYNAYLGDITKELKAEKPDTFVYINVFEHIKDDVKELKCIKDLLPSGGHAIIFVPAHQALFSKFDESIGHFRRYSKQSVTLAWKS
jgi:FkbM family methyltransferase